jgi:hypothetical protein
VFVFNETPPGFDVKRPDSTQDLYGLGQTPHQCGFGALAFADWFVLDDDLYGLARQGWGLIVWTETHERRDVEKHAFLPATGPAKAEVSHGVEDVDNHDGGDAHVLNPNMRRDSVDQVGLLEFNVQFEAVFLAEFDQVRLVPGIQEAPGDFLRRRFRIVD